MCRKRGRIVLVGVTGLELSRADFYEKELTFQVSCSYGPGRYDANYEQKGLDYPIGFVRWTEQRNFEAVLDMLSDGSSTLRRSSRTGSPSPMGSAPMRSSAARSLPWGLAHISRCGNARQGSAIKNGGAAAAPVNNPDGKRKSGAGYDRCDRFWKLRNGFADPGFEGRRSAARRDCIERRRQWRPCGSEIRLSGDDHRLSDDAARSGTGCAGDRHAA